MAVCSWNLFSGCVVVDRGPCVVHNQYLCGNGSRSVRGTRAVAVNRGCCVVHKSGCVIMEIYPCVVLGERLCGSGSRSVRGT
jgi:hypothetical protein